MNSLVRMIFGLITLSLFVGAASAADIPSEIAAVVTDSRARAIIARNEAVAKSIAPLFKDPSFASEFRTLNAHQQHRFFRKTQKRAHFLNGLLSNYRTTMLRHGFFGQSTSLFSQLSGVSSTSSPTATRVPVTPTSTLRPFGVTRPIATKPADAVGAASDSSIAGVFKPFGIRSSLAKMVAANNTAASTWTRGLAPKARFRTYFARLTPVQRNAFVKSSLSNKAHLQMVLANPSRAYITARGMSSSTPSTKPGLIKPGTKPGVRPRIPTRRPIKPGIRSTTKPGVKPRIPTRRPIKPGIRSTTKPGVKPRIPTRRPIKPGIRSTTKPGVKPRIPTRRPIKPGVSKPTKPGIKPRIPTRRPTKPTLRKPTKPKIPTRRPSKPSIPVRKPAKPSVRKPTKPKIPVRKPAKPSTRKPTKPKIPVRKPTVKKPTKPKLPVRKPVAKKPVRKPVKLPVKKPAAKKPTVKPVVKKPAAKKPEARKPTVRKPTVRTPVSTLKRPLTGLKR